MLYLQTGKITAIMPGYVEVKIYNTGQVIKAVKCSPLDLDEREEEPQINLGTEVLVITDDIGNAYAIASMSQGIKSADNKTTTLSNQIVFIGGAQGAIGNTVDIFSSQVKIRNGADDLVHILSDLCQAVADSTPTSGSSAGSSNAMKSTALSLKAKVDAFK